MGSFNIGGVCIDTELYTGLSFAVDQFALTNMTENWFTVLDRENLWSKLKITQDFKRLKIKVH